MNFDMDSTSIFLVSACLLGIHARYDGQCRVNRRCLEMAQKGWAVPFCPEQLGGLSTPRTAADIIGGDGCDVLLGRARVVTRTGFDVTDNFVRGAEEVLRIAQMLSAKKIYLKSKSPSCGVNTLGVTSALLQKHGLTLVECE